mgnify:CR=1 FL=1
MNSEYQTASDLVASVKTLLTLPEVYLRVKSVVDDPESCLTDLVNAISIDAGITARLLRMVNSAYFNLGVSVEHARQAVNLLGMKSVHNLVLATTLSNSFSKSQSSTLNMRKFWEQSVRRAVFSRSIAMYCNEPEHERLFVDGLLSNIGHQVMSMQMSDISEVVMKKSEQTGVALADVENEVIGFNFAEVSAELLSNWGLPKSISEVVRFQLTPELAGEYEKEASIVHIANALALFTDSRFDNDMLMSEINPQAWECTGLIPDNLVDLYEGSNLEVVETTDMLLGAAMAA